jgi:hypothetical protein
MVTVSIFETTRCYFYFLLKLKIHQRRIIAEIELISLIVIAVPRCLFPSVFMSRCCPPAIIQNRLALLIDDLFIVIR